MRKITFTKMVASGNDFIILDNRNQRLSPNLSRLARKLCPRKCGVGADGLLILEKSARADFRMRIFNPDGSEVAMCGNGARCLAWYAKVMRLAKNPMSIDTRAGMLEGRVRGHLVKLRLPEVKVIRANFTLSVSGKKLKASFLNSGVPHVVSFVKDVRKVDIVRLGRAIRCHRAFRPLGTNADFAQIRGNSLELRTYERGVEEETLSCGTGAVASAVASALLKKISPPIAVHTASGEVLKVYFRHTPGGVEDVWLEGKVGLVYRGEI